jgi:putative oxidoreductase
MKHQLIVSAKIYGKFLTIFDVLKDFGDLAVRLWVAKIFLDSALTKIGDWGATIVLFKYVYAVPIMSPTFAAYLGTGAEFILPILLVLGLGGRLSIFVFFMYNLFCMISFHYLWTPAGAAGLADHIDWALLIMMLMFHGCGRISLDHLIHKRWGHLLKPGKTTHFE